jgi:hypothetical protein
MWGDSNAYLTRIDSARPCPWAAHGAYLSGRALVERLGETNHVDHCADDMHGDLCYEREAFFASLQRHKFNEAKEEILFDCGITLNVSQVLRGCEIVRMANPQMLFNKKKLRTTYCFWEDRVKKLKTVKRPHIIGIGGEITRVKEISPIFSIRLSSSNRLAQNQIFMDYTNARVTPIFKHNEGRTNGEIQGWELQ